MLEILSPRVLGSTGVSGVSKWRQLGGIGGFPNGGNWATRKSDKRAGFLLSGRVRRRREDKERRIL